MYKYLYLNGLYNKRRPIRPSHRLVYLCELCFIPCTCVCWLVTDLLIDTAVFFFLLQLLLLLVLLLLVWVVEETGHLVLLHRSLLTDIFCGSFRDVLLMNTKLQFVFGEPQVICTWWPSWMLLGISSCVNRHVFLLFWYWKKVFFFSRVVVILK